MMSLALRPPGTLIRTWPPGHLATWQHHSLVSCDIACHREHVARWERVTQPTFREVLAGIFFLVGCVFLVVFSVSMLRSRHWLISPVVGSLAGYGFLGVWLTAFWRIPVLRQAGWQDWARREPSLQPRAPWEDAAGTKTTGPVLGSEEFDRVVDALHGYLTRST
jgi:hypothetical protein